MPQIGKSWSFRAISKEDKVGRSSTDFKVSCKPLIHMFSSRKACIMQCLNPRHAQLFLLGEPGDSRLQRRSALHATSMSQFLSILSLRPPVQAQEWFTELQVLGSSWTHGTRLVRELNRLRNFSQKILQGELLSSGNTSFQLNLMFLSFDQKPFRHSLEGIKSNPGANKRPGE